MTAAQGNFLGGAYAVVWGMCWVMKKSRALINF
jgi:hypothetical protein